MREVRPHDVSPSGSVEDSLLGRRRVACLVFYTFIEEAKRMPLQIDLSDNKILGPAYRKGLEEGRQEGREEGRQEGRQEGEVAILRRQLEKRFGHLPSWAEERLGRRSA